LRWLSLLLLETLKSPTVLQLLGVRVFSTIFCGFCFSNSFWKRLAAVFTR
jgi:hypothetical protein